MPLSLSRCTSSSISLLLFPLLLPLLSLVLWAGRAVADDPPRIRAARTLQPPVLDGRPDEAVWDLAPPSRSFTQSFPLEGGPPTESTEFRVLYDDEALYVGIDCTQLHTPLTMRLTRRDRDIEADQVRVFVGSRGDGRTAFEFGVTASGVLSDGVLFDDDDYSRSWDENWEAEVARSSRGWSVELRIPLRILRFSSLPVQHWGFNVHRFISGRQETATWSFSPRTESGVVSRFGTLEGLTDLRARHGPELRPFVLGEVTALEPGFGPQSGTDPRLSAGLDVKAHPTQNMTLDGAINLDFGQVEADEVILNLGTIETQHPEKRPFFLEGTDIFSRRVLYTRRIGAVPGSPARRPGETLVERPQPIPIHGALKLVGRPASWLTLGALSALTGAERLAVQSPGGPSEDRPAAPMSLYNVLRLRGELAGGSHLGFIASATNRFEDPGAYPRLDPAAPDSPVLCPGGQRVEPGARCFRDAYVAGFDGRWRSPQRMYSINGQALATWLDNGPPRPQRDGTVLASGDLGPIASLTVAREAGEHWLADSGLQFTGAHADSNDLGFQERQNELRAFTNLTYRTTRPWGPTLETATGLQLFQQTDASAALVLTRLYQLFSEWTLGNFWEVEARLVWSPAAFDDREVGDGAALEHPRRLGGALSFASDPRRALVGELGLRAEWLPGGGRYTAEGELSLRLLPQLDFDIEPSVTHRQGEPRFLERIGAMDAQQYLFGELAATSAGAVLRLTWTFTPRLTLQGFTQLFLLSRRYSAFTSAPAGGRGTRIRLGELRPAAAPLENPDEREGVINANLLLRWEYRLGSTLYLVYTRSQRPRDDTLVPGAPALDLRAVTGGPASSTLLLKLTYWWG